MEKTILIRMPKSAGTSLADTLKRLHKIDIDKGHLFPNKKNIQKYKDYKKIILLRYPKEISEAVKRGIETFVHSPTDFSNWKLKDFERFYFGWIKNLDKNSLLITYDELISNPKKIINRIEGFLGLPKSKKVVLAKSRYTRSKIRKYLRLIYFYLRKIPFLVKIRKKIFGRKPILFVAPDIKSLHYKIKQKGLKKCQNQK